MPVGVPEVEPEVDMFGNDPAISGLACVSCSTGLRLNCLGESGPADSGVDWVSDRVGSCRSGRSGEVADVVPAHSFSFPLRD